MILALLLGVSAWSAAPVACTDTLEAHGQIQIQRMASGTDCYLSVHPMNSNNLVYRDYLFTGDGLMMVFNSYGEGPENETTAAREFYFFPRRQTAPDFVYDDAHNQLIVHHTDGYEYTFDYQTAQLTGISYSQVQVATSVLPANRGGVEVPFYKGLILDAGFKRGSSPTGDAAQSSTFRDEAGHTCRILNNRIFTYYGSGDVTFKFPQDQGLESFLHQNCPQLQFQF